MEEEGSLLVCISTNDFSSDVHTFKRCAIVTVAFSHEPAVVLHGPFLWTLARSRNHQNSLTSGNIAHDTGNVVMVQWKIFRRYIFLYLVLCPVYEGTISGSRTIVKVFRFSWQALIVGTSARMGIVTSSSPSDIHHFSSLCIRAGGSTPPDVGDSSTPRPRRSLWSSVSLLSPWSIQPVFAGPPSRSFTPISSISAISTSEDFDVGREVRR